MMSLRWERYIKCNIGRVWLTSGTMRENPNLIINSTCSIISIAASPGEICHSPSRSYKHTRSTQLVHIDITIRNWNPDIVIYYIMNSSGIDTTILIRYTLYLDLVYTSVRVKQETSWDAVPHRIANLIL